jgi:CSLREA domain-containing protein/uncharacterized repeat protein (TIGR02543 family)
MNKTKLTHTFTKGLHLLVVTALLAGLALGLGPPPVAHADTFTVNDTGDAGDNNPGDGTCATAGGVCTLRAAIEEANALAGDAINFSVTGTITLGGTELDIDSNITITGPGADQLTVNGNEASRVFYIESGTVAISGLTIADGDAGTGDGGGIWNDGDLTLTNCTVSGNEADDDGGGIYNEEDLTLTNCTVSGNEAGDNGGGIYNDDHADLTLTNCTVSGNEAGDNGGGIYNRGDLTLTNCTVSGNEAGDNGGGIYNDEDTDFKNTILANNTATTSGPDCGGGDLDSYGYNLVEHISGCTINEVENVGTNITGQDPNLGPLANNGGPTETHALLAGSPAIDAIPQAAGGDYNGAPATDQRGVPRPQGDNCDIGAFEAGPPILRVSKAGTGTGTVISDPTGINYGVDCAEWYDEDTPVTLTATPDAGSVFAGWSGDCSGTNPTTTVTMDADKTCTATFNLWTPPVPIGGIVVPVNKLGLVAPWLGLAALASLAVLTVALVRRRRSA